MSEHRIDLAATCFAFGCRPLAVANVFFRSGEIETWGRGIQRIFTACKEAGTPRPSLTFDGTGLTLEFRYAPEYLKAMATSEGSTTPEVTDPVTEQVGRLVRIVGTDSRLAADLMTALGLVHRPTFLYTFLQPALSAGLLERTIPAKPNSRLQKYRLTAKGRDWLAAIRP